MQKESICYKGNMHVIHRGMFQVCQSMKEVFYCNYKIYLQKNELSFDVILEKNV